MPRIATIIVQRPGPRIHVIMVRVLEIIRDHPMQHLNHLVGSRKNAGAEQPVTLPFPMSLNL
jgi:hypothetical protein